MIRGSEIVFAWWFPVALMRHGKLQSYAIRFDVDSCGGIRCLSQVGQNTAQNYLSGKIVELAVRHVVHGRPVKNIEALANPEALELFRDRAELSN